MKITINFIFVLGVLAQVFFGLRVVFQWLLSERKKEVASPVIFWAFSLAGCFLFLLYGWFRKDWVITLGQSVSFYIYILNLQLSNTWQRWPFYIRYALLFFPPLVLFMAPFLYPDIGSNFFIAPGVPWVWLMVGFAGQFLLSTRFIYQVFYSIKENKSVLPLLFWVMSLVGSTLLVMYALFRADAILLFAQSIALIPYMRNLYFAIKTKRLAIQRLSP
jgi:lipid-A-disaccharide synthase-like uncharacterized protein